MKILSVESAKVFFSRAGRRAVVVGQVEVRDAHVEGASGDGASVLEHVQAAEVVPPAERDGRQLQPAAADAVIDHLVITVFKSLITHEFSISEIRRYYKIQTAGNVF